MSSNPSTAIHKQVNKIKEALGGWSGASGKEPSQQA
jgi:hypothetical protein